MLTTICPYPDCGHTFTLEELDPSALVDRFPQTVCPACSRSCLAKPIDLLAKLQARAPQGVSGSLPISETKPSLVACLDDIRSLHNVGASFRSADATGFERLYLCGITGCPPRKEIAKVSLGAETWIAFSYKRSIAQQLIELKEKGYFILALERNSQSLALENFLAGENLPRRICLILGNEVQGVSPEALCLADQVVHLSMRGQKESLNVSVAFGIAAYMLAAKCFG